ncbi:MAG: FKBP-type peptidyl-prolyl cis-trans isomerase, partial [Tolumonas sp.]
IGEAFRILNETMAAEEAKRAETMKAAGAEFLTENAKRPEVKVTESGLQYEVLVAGSGKQPAASDKVRVHYHGTFTDGKVFDSSVQRGQPAEFPVGGVIAGWVEALQLMSEGAKWKLFIPHNLAYGERGAGSIPPFSTLVFEVELLNVLA